MPTNEFLDFASFVFQKDCINQMMIKTKSIAAGFSSVMCSSVEYYMSYNMLCNILQAAHIVLQLVLHLRVLHILFAYSSFDRLLFPPVVQPYVQWLRVWKRRWGPEFSCVQSSNFCTNSVEQDGYLSTCFLLHRDISDWREQL